VSDINTDGKSPSVGAYALYLHGQYGSIKKLALVGDRREMSGTRKMKGLIVRRACFVSGDLLAARTNRGAESRSDCA
ncbi:hypothetical protein, partial [Rhodoblastus sp.]|uniref:hypothetical protein n=1 Tax=Rhodoblastus sp. TaxID=1962975 RepID=UPI003F964E61